ncbi:uncharacterized protein K452DRAFT_226814 [Aplosporella prunicola CBS 121167]|uniref:Aquaporin n=1 Tax=Aplosporella prunicola CBS 121167 TaxID=1176127 RepID=A0A6A6BEW2_9PEZI|nr:uncharacterized protein K452DRAFT_226814 [Aplosporella prunicola CBS 121167]KAF2142690.1 hypothetical protein K452DRAFT_226814 [Aplosporella prunicola CBS 121167]
MPSRQIHWDSDSPDWSPPPEKDQLFSPSPSRNNVNRGRRRSARALVGLDTERPMKNHFPGAEKLLWSRIRTTLQEPFAEFLGVMVLTCFYVGSIAQATLSTGQEASPGGAGYGTFMSVPWGTGIGVMLGIYISGDSGSYLNPAITISNCIFRGLPWRAAPAILLSQFLGAFVGSGIIYGNYISAIDWYSGYGMRTLPPMQKSTAQIFATYPQTFAPRSTQVFSVAIPSALITTVISALKDDYNNGISKAGGNFFPLAMFFLFYGVGIAFGWETGGAVNPALDFAGRLMSHANGYGGEVWKSSGYYFWIPMIIPFIGTIFGAFLYDLFIFTGPSPLNTPWLGLKRLGRRDIMARNKQERRDQRNDESTTEV